jgi:hypothetical protein
MIRWLRLLKIMAAFGLLVGCALPHAMPLPTPWPADKLPTVIAMTAAAMATTPAPPATATLTPAPVATSTETPLPTSSPTLPLIAPTYFYFLTITPTATPSFGRAQIEINAPGPMSKVVSPIRLRSYLSPDAVGVTRVELYGEDGRLLTRIVKRTESEFFQYARLALDVQYKIRGVAEVGRLQITAEDRSGHVKDIAAVHVMLLSEGREQITPIGDLQEACLLISPSRGEQISGGTLVIRGAMRPFSNLPVLFELVDNKGVILGSRVLVFQPPDGKYQDFLSDIPYKVGAPTSGFLFVRQSDDRIEGPIYVYSQPITLNP